MHASETFPDNPNVRDDLILAMVNLLRTCGGSRVASAEAGDRVIDCEGREIGAACLHLLKVLEVKLGSC